MKIKNAILSAVIAATCLMATSCSSNNSSNTESTAAPTVSDSSNASSDKDNSSESESSAVEGELNSSGEGNINMQLKAGDTIAEITVEGYGTIKAKLLPEVAPKGVDNFIKLANNGYYDGKTIHRVMSDFMLQGGSLNGDGTGGDAADGGYFGVEPNTNARHFYGALCYANAMGRNTTQFYIVNNNKPQDISTISIADLQTYVEVFAGYKAMFEPGTTEYEYYGSSEEYYKNLIKMIEAATDEVKAQYKAQGGTPTLDGGYTVFGQVYEGFDVIDSISSCKVIDSGTGELSTPAETITITSVKISEYAG